MTTIERPRFRRFVETDPERCGCRCRNPKGACHCLCHSTTDGVTDGVAESDVAIAQAAVPHIAEGAPA
jgi:hypothetical protein